MAKDHSDPEDEYFKRQEMEQLKKLREKVEAEEAAKAREARKQAYWLRCGKCGGVMGTQVFKGVEIDVCPDCGSVLLDPGELETLVGKDHSGAMGVLSDLFSFTRKK